MMLAMIRLPFREILTVSNKPPRTTPQSDNLRQLEQTLIDHMALYGYQLLNVPIIESADLFLTRASDRIIDQLFRFERAGREFALRPEFTAIAAHRYLENGFTEPVRWQFAGPVFADEPTEQSQLYQKHSIGAELLGEAGLQADAEMIAMAVQGIQKLGIEDWSLVSGHVALQLHLLSKYELNSRTSRLLLAQRDILKNPKNSVQDAIAKVTQELPKRAEQESDRSANNIGEDVQTEQILGVLLDSTRHGTTMGGRTRQDIAQRLLQKRERSLEQGQIEAALNFLAKWTAISASIDEAFDIISDWIEPDDTIGRQILDDWRQSIELLEAYDIPKEKITIQANLTQNWDYYSGIVFGIRLDSGDFVAGGGRYDALAQLLGSETPIPAVGFAYYVDRFQEFYSGAITPQRQFVLDSREMYVNEAERWANFLRKSGIAVVMQANSNGVDDVLTGSGEDLHYKGIVYTHETADKLVSVLKAIAQ